MSARSARTSTSLPFPSSPHWAPTTTTHVVRASNIRRPPTGQQKKSPAWGRYILQRNVAAAAGNVNLLRDAPSRSRLLRERAPRSGGRPERKAVSSVAGRVDPPEGGPVEP